eukprot:7697659-Alexandrium_andersonii.AAC.1
MIPRSSRGRAMLSWWLRRVRTFRGGDGAPTSQSESHARVGGAIAIQFSVHALPKDSADARLEQMVPFDDTDPEVQKLRSQIAAVQERIDHYKLKVGAEATRASAMIAVIILSTVRSEG